MDFDNLSADEKSRLERLLSHAETLERIARKEEAWTIVSSSIKSILIGLAAVLTAGFFLWDKFKALIQAAVK